MEALKRKRHLQQELLFLDGALESEIVHTEQTAEIIDWQAGEACFLGSNGEQEMTVEDARVLIPAGMVEDFPEDENLVAINVSYQSYYEEYYYYYAVDKFYVGYGGNTFKEAMEPYYLEDYTDVLGGITPLDAYELSYEDGQECSFYRSGRNLWGFVRGLYVER